MDDMKKPEAIPPKKRKFPWWQMMALAVTGQLAWAVENSWFGTFVFDHIAQDARPVAWMTAASAVTATLTAIFMGTLSDRTRSRYGKRKLFILFGYILWGVMTIVFPMTAWFKNLTLSVIMVVLADCLMTFFGSMANDAAFNAWTVDVTPSNRRGRVEGLLNVAMFIAQIISLTLAGVLIDQFGYFRFFYTLGAIVILAGLVAGLLLPDKPSDHLSKPEKTFWQELSELLQWRMVTENRMLFILLLVIMISGIGMQICYPYLVIYVTHNLGYSRSEFALIGGAVMLGSLILAVPLGGLADRMNKRKMIIAAIVLSSLGCFLFSLGKSIAFLSVAGLMWQAFYVAISIATVAWLKDLLPAESRGKFMGIRMIFWVMIPMVIGPFLSVQVLRWFGGGVTAGADGAILPQALLFQVGALVALLAALPLLLTKTDKSNLVHNQTNQQWRNVND